MDFNFDRVSNGSQCIYGVATDLVRCTSIAGGDDSSRRPVIQRFSNAIRLLFSKGTVEKHHWRTEIFSSVFLLPKSIYFKFCL